MIYALLIVVLSVGASPTIPPIDGIAVLERNHCINSTTGEQRFVQLIHWNRYGRTLHVDFWEMEHDKYVLYPVPGENHTTYRLIRWKRNRIRIFRVDHIMETYTVSDPEANDRKLLPVAARRGLPK